MATCKACGTQNQFNDNETCPHCTGEIQKFAEEMEEQDGDE